MFSFFLFVYPRPSLQGLVNLVDVGPDTTGTLMVKDKSHLAHSDFFDHHTSLTQEEKAAIGDFYKFQPQELPYWDSFTSLGLSAKAGDLFLWDSRAAHQNIGPAMTTDWRHVVYVCYQARSLAEEEDLKLKRQAWEEYLVTTHWPSRNVAVFPGLGKNKTYYKSEGEGEEGREGGGEAADGVEGGAEGGVGMRAETPSPGAAADGGGNGHENSSSSSSSKGVENSSSSKGVENSSSSKGVENSSSSKGVENSSSSSSESSPSGDGGEGDTDGSDAVTEQMKAALSYWEGRVLDGSAEELLRGMRNRQNVEDGRLRKLAGVEEYEGGEVWQREPLLKLWE